MMSRKNLWIFYGSIKSKITEKDWDFVEYDKDYIKIKFESNNIFHTDKDVIRAVFAQDGKYYPQLFLDSGLYKNVRV